MYKNIYLASDHSAVAYKNIIKKYLSKDFNVIDLGTNSTASCNYAEYGHKLAFAIRNDESSLGIALCGSGIGISIAANRIDGIRCALLYNDEVAKLARQHNNANIIAFGSRQMQITDILKRIDIFLDNEFEGKRHLVRIQSLD